MLGKLHRVVLHMANSPSMYSRVTEGHMTLNTLTRSVEYERTTLSASPESYIHYGWSINMKLVVGSEQRCLHWKERESEAQVLYEEELLGNN